MITNIILTLLHCTGDPLISLSVTGNTEQDSTTGLNKWNYLAPAWLSGLTRTGSVYANNATDTRTYFQAMVVLKDESDVIVQTTPSPPYINCSSTGVKYITFTVSGANAAKIQLKHNGSVLDLLVQTNLPLVQGQTYTMSFNVLGYNPSIVGGLSFTDVMLAPGTATAYEPYTGGVPAPNPDYPYDILSVGDLATSADSDWNTPIQYGKTSFVGTAPSALGVDCYRVPICVSGLNLVDKTTFTDNKYIAYNTGVVSNGTGTTFITAFTPVLPNKTIYWKNNSTSQVSGIAFYSSAQVYISGVQSINGGAITTPANARYFRATFYYAAASYDTAIINYGSSAPSAYEPYHAPVTYNMYLDAPLRYGDTLDETGLLTRNSAKVILKGTEDWLLYFGNYSTNAADANAKTTSSVLCSHFYGTDQIVTTNGTYRLKIFASALPAEVVDVASLKTWLAANPATVIYPVATPTTSTNYTMPAQIDTFAGTTIIQLDTTTQPSILEAEYWSTEET